MLIYHLFDSSICKRFWEKVDVLSDNECWDWKASLCGKYGQFGIKASVIQYSHRVAFTLWNKRDIAVGLFLMHSCDNTTCCNPKHLSEGTLADNNADMRRKGRQASGNLVANKGENNGRAKLDKGDVLAIRSLSKYMSYEEIARIYDVQAGAISRISRRVSWKHVI